MLPKRTFNVSKIIKFIIFSYKRSISKYKKIKMKKKSVCLRHNSNLRLFNWIWGMSLCWLSYRGNKQKLQKLHSLYIIENVTVFPSSLYSLERMEGIPFFFLWSIYTYLRISRKREIIHIRFWPGTLESNQRPITC